MLVIKIADIAIGLDNRYEFIEKFAADYLSDEQPEFTVCATDEDIERVCKPFQMWDHTLPWNENNEPKDKVLQALRAIAKELHVPVLCTMHSHRSLERRKNKRPRLEDLKKAEVSAELADQIVFLYRDRYYDPDGNDGAECIIAKSSQGSTGMVALDWDYTTGRFL